MKTITPILALLFCSIASAQAQDGATLAANAKSKHLSLKQNVVTAKKINPLHAHSIESRHLPANDVENVLAKDAVSTNNTMPVAEIRAFPNPFSNQIDVIITDGAMARSVYTASLYDMNGKKVHTETLKENQSSLLLSELSAGAYILHIEKNGILMKQQKFIKQ